MPIFSRKTLRQALGSNHLRDTIVGNVQGTWAVGAQSLPSIVDVSYRDLTMSGQNLYERSWIYIGGMELRVASFNVGSGAYISGGLGSGGWLSGAEYERHDLVPPTEKNRAIDDSIKRLRLLQEVPVESVDDAEYYPIERLAAALPNEIIEPTDVMDVYYYADAANSLDRNRRELDQWSVIETGSGIDLHISPRLPSGNQIIMQAMLAMTLGSTDVATINIPDERLVLFGAEAQCWHLLSKSAPGTNRATYEQSRNEAAMAYSDLAAKFKRPVDRKLEFDRPVHTGGAGGWW